MVKANTVDELLNKDILKKITFETKYQAGPDNKNKMKKERLYFMGSVYPDTKVLTKSDIKDGLLIKKAIKHKSRGGEAEFTTNFATLFNFNKENDTIIQQPYNGAPSIFGVMYKDYNTLFYGKNDSFGEKQVGNIMKKIEEGKENIDTTGEGKVFFGKNLNKEMEYLKRFDNYENRVREAIARTKKDLKINDIFDKNSRDKIKEALKKNFKLQYKKEKDAYVTFNDKNKTLSIGTGRNGFDCNFSVEKDAILEKSGIMNCNEFVSTGDEKIASAFFFCDKNSLEDFFYKPYADSDEQDDKPISAQSSFVVKALQAQMRAEESDCYEGKTDKQRSAEEFYKEYNENFRNLVLFQKKLGLPYIPILYKNDDLGYRLENMKLSVFAKKINDGLSKSRTESLFSEKEIKELENFENGVKSCNNNDSGKGLSDSHKRKQNVVCTCNII